RLGQTMSARVKALGERKALLVARLQLQRMEVVLRANELREAIRPASLIGGAVAQPAALIAIFDTIAPILGLRKWSRWVRAGSVRSGQTMSARVKALGERKALLVARLQLQRMEVVLRANELREAIRPASLIGGAVAQPAALIAIFDTIAPILGLRKWSRWVRAGSVRS